MTPPNVARLAEPTEGLEDRVRAAIEDGKLETAKRLLLDLCREKGDAQLADDALGIASRHAIALRSNEIDGRDTSAEINAIAKAMLALVRELERVPNPYVPERAIPVGPGPELRLVFGAPPEQHLTELEHAQLNFEAAARTQVSAQGTAIWCERIGKRFSRRGFALRDVSLSLPPGKLLGLVGENGSGKTTLLRILAGEVQSSDGSITYPSLGSGKEPIDWREVRRRIAYVRQTPLPWYGRLVDTLHITAARHSITGERNDRTVRFWLHRLGLAEYANHTWEQISGGYKMRFELACALVRRPALLILDEPLAPLDIIAQRTFLQDLRDLACSQRYPLPIVVSSQHLYEIELVADQLMFLRNGVVGYYGPPNAFRSTESTNLFELACNYNRNQLINAILPLGECRVEEFGKRFLIRTPRSVTANVLLSGLTGAGGSIEYFHDLTSSTRRLFEEGRRGA